MALRNLFTDTTRGEKVLFLATLVAILVGVYVSIISRDAAGLISIWSVIAILVGACIWSVHKPKGDGL